MGKEKEGEYKGKRAKEMKRVGERKERNRGK